MTDQLAVCHASGEMLSSPGTRKMQIKPQGIILHLCIGQSLHQAFHCTTRSSHSHGTALPHLPTPLPCLKFSFHAHITSTIPSICLFLMFIVYWLSSSSGPSAPTGHVNRHLLLESLLARENHALLGMFAIRLGDVPRITLSVISVDPSEGNCAEGRTR